MGRLIARIPWKRRLQALALGTFLGWLCWFGLKVLFAPQPLYELTFNTPGIQYSHLKNAGPWWSLDRLSGGIGTEVRDLQTGKRLATFPEIIPTDVVLQVPNLGQSIVYQHNDDTKTEILAWNPLTDQRKVLNSGPSRIEQTFLLDQGIIVETAYLNLAYLAALAPSGFPAALHTAWMESLSEYPFNPFYSSPLITIRDLFTQQTLSRTTLPASFGVSTISILWKQDRLSFNTSLSIPLNQYLNQKKIIPDTNPDSPWSQLLGLKIYDLHSGKLLHFGDLYGFREFEDFVLVNRFSSTNNQWPLRFDPLSAQKSLLDLESMRIFPLSAFGSDGEFTLSKSDRSDVDHRLIMFWADRGQSSGMGGRIVWYDFQKPVTLVGPIERKIPYLQYVKPIQDSDQFVLSLDRSSNQNFVNQWMRKIPWLGKYWQTKRTELQVVDFQTDEVLLQKQYVHPIVFWEQFSADQRILLLAEFDSGNDRILRIQAYAVPFPPVSLLQQWTPSSAFFLLVFLTLIVMAKWRRTRPIQIF
jgi:hypothetical protein